MADDAQEHIVHDRPCRQDIDTQLEYPQLLIEASFASLLSHSQSSGSQTIGPMPHSHRSLSESWSSLSERDLSHDDDLQSEPTDAGSLIDVSTADDIHSVDGHEENSDIGDYSDNGSEEPGTTTDNHFDRNYYSQDRDSVGNTGPCPQENITLEDSGVVVEEGGATSPQAGRSFMDITTMQSSTLSLHSDNGSDGPVHLMMMPMSTSSLVFTQRPYHVLYHGSAFTSSEIKSDVLGKIGAALISGSDQHRQEDDAESPCYHVIPSEFGPGSKPSIADLIPIPTQMHVSDCTALEDQPKSANNICLHLSPGKKWVSRAARFYEILSSKATSNDWKRPDLAVVVVSQHDSTEDRAKASNVVEFARRHQIPALALRQEAGWDEDQILTAQISPQMLHKRVWSASEYAGDEAGCKMLVDVDTFINLDTQQLNQHLNHITVSISQFQSRPYQFLGNLKACFRQGWHQIATSLPLASLVKQVDNSETHSNATHNWIVETVLPQAQCTSEKAWTTQKSPRFWQSENVEVILRAIRYLSTIMFWTAFATIFMYSYHLMSPLVTSTKTLPMVPTNIPNHCTGLASQSVSSKPVVSATSPTSESYALSGPLQVLEQQVQSWLPRHIAGLGQKERDGDAAAVVEAIDEKVVKACTDIVPARISSNLKVPSAFFDAGNPAFTVDVRRGDEKISAKVEKRADNTAMIMIKRKDCHGQLMVNLVGPGERICASLDLGNLVHETLAQLVKNLHHHNLKFKTANKIANDDLRLLEIRSTRPGSVSTAVDLHYSATQGTGAAVEAVEKRVGKRAKIYHQKRDKGLMRRMTDMVHPIRDGRPQSENLVRTTHRHILDTAEQAKSRANEVTDHAKAEMSKAIQVMHASVRELVPITRMWSGGVKQTLKAAQERASTLVKKGSQPNFRRNRIHEQESG